MRGCVACRVTSSRARDAAGTHVSATSVGLGSAHPLVEEINPDGSTSPAGQHFNRRVELVDRLPR